MIKNPFHFKLKRNKNNVNYKVLQKKKKEEEV